MARSPAIYSLRAIANSLWHFCSKPSIPVISPAGSAWGRSRLGLERRAASSEAQVAAFAAAPAVSRLASAATAKAVVSAAVIDDAALAARKYFGPY